MENTIWQIDLIWEHLVEKKLEMSGILMVMKEMARNELIQFFDQIDSCIPRLAKEKKAHISSQI